jgi:hypothetical protein
MHRLTSNNGRPAVPAHSRLAIELRYWRPPRRLYSSICPRTDAWMSSHDSSLSKCRSTA